MTAGPSTYLVTVAGHLDDHWSALLGGADLVRDPCGDTTLTFTVADQSQLHGMLTALRDIGAVLTELRATSASPAPELALPLHTDRLTLWPATATDAEATWAYRRLASVGEWLTGGPGDLADYRGIFTRPERLATTVVARLGVDAAGPVVGDLMLRREDGWAQVEVAERARRVQAELGWTLDPAHTGRGYATEAVRELVRHCFEDLGVRRVTASCFLANDASWRLMERVGMRREQHAVRESLHRVGEWRDVVGYALLADEWCP